MFINLNYLKYKISEKKIVTKQHNWNDTGCDI